MRCMEVGLVVRLMWFLWGGLNDWFSCFWSATAVNRCLKSSIDEMKDKMDAEGLINALEGAGTFVRYRAEKALGEMVGSRAVGTF